MILAHTLVPPIAAVTGSATALAGTSTFSGKAASAKDGIRFGSILAQQSASQSSSSDVIARIAALLQSGTPMSTIVDMVAKNVTARVKNATPKLQHLTDDASKALLAAIRSALAPPGTAPPNQPAAEQAVALLRRVRNVLDSVAREMGTASTGQQNEISGNILDASAKDIPAHRTGTTPTKTPVDLGSLAQTIANQSATPLQAGTVVSATVPVPIQSLQPVIVAHTTPTPLPQFIAQPPMTPIQDGQAGAQPTQPVIPASLPDLLGRMLNRAATGNARTSINSVDRIVSGNSTITDVSFARLISSIERSTSRDGAPGTKTVLRSDNALAGITAPASDVKNGQNADPTALQPYTTIDPETLLSQIVKGVAVQAGIDGAHTIQLHLQPANLGSVNLKLSVDGSNVSASVIAQNGDVRDVLLSNQHHLARAFSDAGMNLTGFSVDVSGGDARGFKNEQQSQGFGRRYVVHETAGADVVDSVDAASTSLAASNGRLDLLDALA